MNQRENNNFSLTDMIDNAVLAMRALTVHDEFIVPQDKEDAVLECRYTVGLNEDIYGAAY